MAEINPLRLRDIVWKTKRQQRMAVIVNALHALMAFSCFCFMHVDTGYDWGLTEALRTSSTGHGIKDKMETIAKSEGYKSAEDFMWKMKVVARVVSVVKQVSFGYCLLNLLKLVTCFPIWAPTGVMKKNDYLHTPPNEPCHCNPHEAWNFEAVCTYVALFVYFWSCICVLGVQFGGTMPKPLWPFSVGAALGMLAMWTFVAYGPCCQICLEESTESPD